MYAELSAAGCCQKPRWQQCGSIRASKGLVHRVAKSAVHPLDDVGIGVEGDVYAGVTKKFLHVLRMLACHEEYCSAGVPKIMEPDSR
jgi:hypothetical protein